MFYCLWGEFIKGEKDCALFPENVPTGAAVATWPPIFTWITRAVAYIGTDPLHFPPATECPFLLFSLSQAFSSCRSKIEGISSFVCNLSYPASFCCPEPLCSPLHPSSPAALPGSPPRLSHQLLWGDLSGWGGGACKCVILLAPSLSEAGLTLCVAWVRCVPILGMSFS